MQISKKNTRQFRVATEIKKAISEFLLNNSIVDNYFIDSSMISLTEVLLSPCLQHAKVFAVSLAEISNSDARIYGAISSEDCVFFLERHAQKIRRYVGATIHLRYIPDFKFFVDNTSRQAEKIEQLIKRLPSMSQI
ncbi:MAG: ribosome-binding factor A [Holosporaceae bacterium]|jgi:ribosome-binding factor A|nr:ribosome-binding factor A [Holosporaceae bacterium]